MFIGQGEGDVTVEDLQLRGQTTNQVEGFTYIGSVVTSDGKCMQDIDRRRAGPTTAFGM